jgi:hypothetical protein
MATELVDWIDIHKLCELEGRRLLTFIGKLRAGGVPVARIAGATMVHVPTFRAFASKQATLRKPSGFTRGRQAGEVQS